jgi:hypothetical protein
MDMIMQQLGISKAVAAEAAKQAAIASVKATVSTASSAATAAEASVAAAAAGAPGREAAVAGDAAIAAAGVASWAAAEGTPLPAALAEGALAFAAIMGAYGPLAVLEQGGILPDNQLAFLHKNEMVLPAGISKGVQGMINGGSAGGRQLTLHYHGYQGQSNESMKMDVNQIGKHVKKLARQGRI